MYLKKLFFCILILNTTTFLRSQNQDSRNNVSKTAIEVGYEQPATREHPAEGDVTIIEFKRYTQVSKKEPMAVLTLEGSMWRICLKTGTIVIEPEKSEEETGSVTGTIFGGEEFKFHHFELEWKINEQNKTLFKSRVYFYNTKYGSYAEALNKKGGLAQIEVPIDANGDRDNPKFTPTLKAMKNIKNPGDSATIKSEESYSYFKNFPERTTFEYFESTFYDKLAGQNYPYAKTVRVPLNKESNFISHKQFFEAFGTTRDSNGNLLKNTIPPADRQTSSPQDATGLEVSPVKGH